MPVVIPGVLTDDENDYRARLRKAESVAGLVQIDIIDGKFAPNVTVGVDTVNKYPSTSSLEVQLMVVEPSRHIKDLIDSSFVSKIIFPFETSEDVAQNIKEVGGSGKLVGLSINPETAVSAISAFEKYLDVLCIFSASPGFSGKKLEEVTYERIARSKTLYPDLPVEVDIGVNLETAPKLVRAGADFLVATSALHNSANYQSAYGELAQVVKDADN